MKKLLVVLALLLVASSGYSIIEPDDNMMGFYFDADADVYSAFDTPAYSPVVMYLTLVNPTFDELHGFEVGYTMDGLGQILNVTFTNPTALSIGLPGNHIVGFGEPTVMAPANIIATVTVFYMDAEACDPLEFIIHGTNPSSIDPAYPVVWVENDLIMTTGISLWDGVSSAIYGDCSVENSPTTLDSIKSLYR